MKNYLFSGKINEIGKKLLQKDLVGAKVLVAIGTSNDYDKNDMYFFSGTEKYPSTISVFKEISNIEKFILLDGRTTGVEAQNILSNADVIFLTGGDPFYQIKYIKDNGLDETLMKYNGVIIGISAGSMNQSKVVYYSKDEQYNETLTYDGLGIVDVTIEPHFDVSCEEQLREIKEWSKKIDIIGLPDESFVVVSDNEIKTYGETFIYNSIK